MPRRPSTNGTPVRQIALTVAGTALLAGPTALAFADGGYFAGARLTALVIAALVVAVVALAAPVPLPRTHAARAALGALAALAGWIAVAGTWAPLQEPARADAERALLYLAALGAAAAVLRTRSAGRMAEPVLAAGATLAVAYALLEPLGLRDLPDSVAAAGRLHQPLGYWNATGALAAIGLILCARIAGDRERPEVLRAVAAAAAAPLGAGLYLTYSRGALAALAAGLVVLIVLAPTWSQLRAAVNALLAGGVAALASEAPAAAFGLVLVVAAIVAAAVQATAHDAEQREGVALGRLALGPRPGWIAAALVTGLFAVPVALSAVADDASGEVDGATAARLTTVGSPRADYWEVAMRAFADHPLAGLGPGGFAVEWLRERPAPRPARDAHSLPIETAAELGVIGLALLALLVAALTACAHAAQRADPAFSAGPAAALTTYAFHASLDWDWEIPALTLVAFVLAGALVARAEHATAPSATRPAPRRGRSAACP